MEDIDIDVLKQKTKKSNGVQVFKYGIGMCRIHVAIC